MAHAKLGSEMRYARTHPQMHARARTQTHLVLRRHNHIYHTQRDEAGDVRLIREDSGESGVWVNDEAADVKTLHDGDTLRLARGDGVHVYGARRFFV